MFPRLPGFLPACLGIFFLLLARAHAIDAAVTINEVHYHAVAGDTEWIELHSLSGVDIDMSGWRLADAVDYAFPEGTKIAGHGYMIIAATPGAVSLAGARALVVGNTAAFAQRYGGGVTILGASYQPGDFLSNSGDHITLLAASGAVIRDFDYNDRAPWPESPDGGGYSLVLIRPASNPDHGDGIVNLLQYALAGATPYTRPLAGSDGSFLTLTFRRNLAADDTTLTVQRSTDLATWTSGTDVAYVSETHNTDGTATYVWRSAYPLGGANPREFLRVRVTKP